MRSILVLSAILLLPLAAAALPVPPTAAPALCGEECRITAASTGYDPAVAVIASGSSVVWHSPDITHVTRDITASQATPPCFEVLAEQGADTPAVRFELAGTQLLATVDGETTPCANAVATPGGAVLPYFCSIHPTMRAAIVVTSV